MYCKDFMLSMYCNDIICFVMILFIYCNDIFKMYCKDIVCIVMINVWYFLIKFGKYL